ncbi:MAG: hypothetical protein DRR03_03345 [Gammaproteobacteria bacterium]|nr:MAG: hypothetical protein DRR03_03345 [Gammaproteobacteria bacterium]
MTCRRWSRSITRQSPAGLRPTILSPSPSPNVRRGSPAINRRPRRYSSPNWRDRLSGYVTLSTYRGGRGAFAGCREISYYVAGAFRRRGVASALLEHAVDACAELGVDLLLTFALAHNDASVAFLERHGFDCRGRSPGVAVINGQCFDHVIHGRHLRSL